MLALQEIIVTNKLSYPKKCIEARSEVSDLNVKFQ